MLSKNYTGALVTQDIYGDFYCLVFDSGTITDSKCLDSEDMDSAVKETKAYLKEEEITARKIFEDEEEIYSEWVHTMLDEGCIYDGSSNFGSDDDDDDDDDDCGIASYYSDPNHWPDGDC